jgi:hypothetical protein
VKGWHCVLGLVLLVPAGAWCLEADDTTQALPTGPLTKQREDAFRRLRVPANVSDFGVLGPQLILETSSESKRATATVGVETGSLALNLKLTGPLDDKTKEAIPVDLDGLAGSSVADLGVAWTYWPFHPDIDALKALCQRATGGDDCDDSDFTDPELRRRYFQLQHASDHPLLLGARVRVGRNRFNYLDPTALSASGESHNDWAIVGSAGAYWPSLGYLGGVYEYQEYYKPGSSPSEVCVPLGDAGASQCKDAVIGPPKKEQSQLARVFLRRFFKGARAAVQPSFSRDFTKKVTSFDLPIYFLQSTDEKKPGLTGGVRFGWRSDTDDWVIAVFIGPVLGLVERP